MASNGRAAAARLHEKGNAPEVVGRGASTGMQVQRGLDSPLVAQPAASDNTHHRAARSAAVDNHHDRKRAAHAKEARLQAERFARLKDKPPELRAAIALAERKDRQRRTALASETFMAVLRLSEVRRVLHDRYGGEDFVLPDDDAGKDDAVIFANSLARLSRGRVDSIVRELRCHAPWMSEATALRIACRAISSPTSYKADTLAHKLGVTDATRTRLDLRTIGATDVDAEARKARRRSKDAERAKAKRKAKGASTRHEYEANSAESLKPWEALGIKRRWYYELKKRGQLPGANETAQVHRQYIAVGDNVGYDALVQSDAVEQDGSTGAARGPEAAPDQAVVQVVQQAPRNRASGFVPPQRASDAPSRAPLQTVQPAHRPIRGSNPATATETAHV